MACSRHDLRTIKAQHPSVLRESNQTSTEPLYYIATFFAGDGCTGRRQGVVSGSAALYRPNVAFPLRRHHQERLASEPAEDVALQVRHGK
ncbi:hypothetical protein TYRP_023734 [Tyrophagus putrescentiae]|nr:hypothetical protein TYRP_023734 [Tyrophagus putrescentiae]